MRNPDTYTIGPRPARMPLAAAAPPRRRHVPHHTTSRVDMTGGLTPHWCPGCAKGAAGASGTAPFLSTRSCRLGQAAMVLPVSVAILLAIITAAGWS